MNHAFALQYGVNVLDMYIEHIVDDTVPTNYLPAQAQCTYVGCKLFARLLIKNEHALLPIECLGAMYWGKKNYGVTQWKKRNLQSDPWKVVLFTKADESFVPNWKKASSLQALSLYSLNRYSWMVVCDDFEEIARADVSFIMEFLKEKLIHMRDARRKIKHLFLKNRSTFEVDPSNKKKWSKRWPVLRGPGLVVLETRFGPKWAVVVNLEDLGKVRKYVGRSTTWPSCKMCEVHYTIYVRNPKDDTISNNTRPMILRPWPALEKQRRWLRM